VEALDVSSDGHALKATLRTRARLPAYTLKGYRLRWVVYSAEGYPVEQHEADLPDMAPGSVDTFSLGIGQPLPARVQVDVVRQTGFSARSAVWTA
jgi:beta-glucuronidase